MSTGSGSMTPVSSGVTLTSYVTLSEANAYFNNRLVINPWNDASDDNKSKALNMAAAALNRLNYAGEVNDSEQVHQFPRDDDTAIPQPMKDACCLCAAVFLDDVTVDDLREEARFQFQAYGTVKQTYKDGNLPHFMAGIPSAEAWDLIQPFLRQNGNVQLNRVS